MAFFGAMLIARLFVAKRRHLPLNAVLLLLTAVTCYRDFPTRCLHGIRRGCGCRDGDFVALVGEPLAPLALLCCLALPSRRWTRSLASRSQFRRALVRIVRGATRRLERGVRGVDVAAEDCRPCSAPASAQIEESAPDYFLVDNGFLAVGAQIGLIGCWHCWCWVMLSLFRDMLQTAWQTHSALAIGVAALLSTWMMRSMFDPLFALYPLYAFLAFWAVYSVPTRCLVFVQNRQVAAMTVTINGRYLSQRVTGVERYAREVVARSTGLPRIVSPRSAARGRAGSFLGAKRAPRANRP